MGAGSRLLLIGMSVPVVMTNVEDVRKVILEEGSTPESWEMVDLEESMKKLLASSSVPSVQVSEEILISNVSKSVTTGLPPSSTDHLNAVRDTDQVDSFLKEALQNPRDRLTSNTLSCYAACFMAFVS